MEKPTSGGRQSYVLCTSRVVVGAGPHMCGPAGSPARSSCWWPVWIASQDISSSRRCWGSINSTSLEVREKREASKRSTPRSQPPKRAFRADLPSCGQRGAAGGSRGAVREDGASRKEANGRETADGRLGTCQEQAGRKEIRQAAGRISPWVPPSPSGHKAPLRWHHALPQAPAPHPQRRGWARGPQLTCE